MKQLIISAASAALLAMASAGPAMAADSNAAVPLTVVAHLDIARAALDNALGYLHDYVATSEHQPGAVSVQLLRQVTNSNHFTLVEVWSDNQAYEAHLASAAVRQFHAKLDPLLGSPHDERLFAKVAGNP